MQAFERLLPGAVYHVYNRGINGENLFKTEADYSYFLRQYAEYVAPVVDTFAYCLLKNHFHLLVRIKDFSDPRQNWEALAEEKKWKKPADATKQLGHFFNSYTQHINALNGRTGGLFMTPFRRKPVQDDQYLSAAIGYVHTNAQRHGFVADYKAYPHSSFGSYLSERPTLLAREEGIGWFGGAKAYFDFHEKYLNDRRPSEFEIELD